MKILVCEKCGGSDFLEQNGFRICRYCNSMYSLGTEDTLPRISSISLSDDIKMLLQKCRNDPANAPRYASLILDIDPSNKEAAQYLTFKM